MLKRLAQIPPFAAKPHHLPPGKRGHPLTQRFHQVMAFHCFAPELHRIYTSSFELLYPLCWLRSNPSHIVIMLPKVSSLTIPNDIVYRCGKTQNRHPRSDRRSMQSR